jgi:hypothetical protein
MTGREKFRRNRAENLVPRGIQRINPLAQQRGVLVQAGPDDLVGSAFKLLGCVAHPDLFEQGSRLHVREAEPISGPEHADDALAFLAVGRADKLS